jgi:excisionase family DNA binding protein
MTRLLSIPQAADALGVHRTTIHRMVADGRLDAISYGKRTRRIREDQLLAPNGAPGVPEPDAKTSVVAECAVRVSARTPSRSSTPPSKTVKAATPKLTRQQRLGRA